MNLGALITGRDGEELHQARFNEDGFASGTSGPAEFAARCRAEISGLQAALAELPPPRTSIEVGAGYGRLTPWIADFSERHIAVEPDDWARQTGHTLYPGIEWIDAVAQRLPFDDGEVDLAVTWTVLQHLPETDARAAITELCRVVGSSGVIVCCEETTGTGTWSPPGRFSGTVARSVETYAELFEPFELIQRTPRPLEQTYPRQAGHIMVFQRRAR